MTKHMVRDFEHLKRKLLGLGSIVEEAINNAILALLDRRHDLGEEVISGDRQIDLKELDLEEDCLKALALYQPVAGDLRFIITVLKVNNDLERMGDLAVNIAERASYLSVHPALKVSLDFARMVTGVRRMVRDSLDALIRMDTGLARTVITMDDEIDTINRDMFISLQELMKQDSDTVERSVHLLSTSRNLERIADLCTNIAEDVVFMVDGDLIRHRNRDYRKAPPANQN